MVEQESYTCPKCGMTSYHPDDVKNEYCANCHQTKGELEFEKLLKPLHKMTEGEALFNLGARPAVKDGKVGLNFPKLGFIQASDEKPDFIVATGDKRYKVKGDKKAKCSRCRCKLWIAPSTQEVLRRYPGTPILCLACTMKQSEEEKENSHG